MFSKKATKIDKIFTVNLKLCSKRHIDGEDLVNFCGLLRKHELTGLRINFAIYVEFHNISCSKFVSCNLDQLHSDLLPYLLGLMYLKKL